jgi:hypothetical protein
MASSSKMGHYLPGCRKIQTCELFPMLLDSKLILFTKRRKKTVEKTVQCIV